MLWINKSDLFLKSFVFCLYTRVWSVRYFRFEIDDKYGTTTSGKFHTNRSILSSKFFILFSKNVITQWAKSPKKQSAGDVFWQHGIVFWVLN